MSKLAKIAVITSLLVAATAHAEMPQRVLIVDTVSFSPALEKANARQKMMDAVNATVAQHAWQPVPSADCHNLTCVGPAAAAATANYALILTGSYAHGGDEMYATEVGVSFWHDGGFVARWTEEDEQAEAAKTPAGVFFPCGPPSGTCVAPLMTSKMQQYSARLLEAESAAIKKRAGAAAVAAVTPSVAAAPVISGTTAAAPAPPPPESGVGRIVGWSLVGVGVAALATGISFWALDGRASSKCGSVDHVCDVYDTRTTGVILTAIGAAGVVAGGLLVWRAESDRGPQVAVGLGSLLVRGRF